MIFKHTRYAVDQDGGLHVEVSTYLMEGTHGVAAPVTTEHKDGSITVSRDPRTFKIPLEAYGADEDLHWLFFAIQNSFIDYTRLPGYDPDKMAEQPSHPYWQGAFNEAAPLVPGLTLISRERYEELAKVKEDSENEIKRQAVDKLNAGKEAVKEKLLSLGFTDDELPYVLNLPK